MNEIGVKVIEDALKTLDDSPGVYRMLDGDGQTLYVGKAKRLRRRVVSYTRPQTVSRLKRMVSLTASMLFLTTKTENEALLLEQQLIRELSPPYNVKLKDSKGYPGVTLTTTSSFPRVKTQRGRPAKGDLFFGPFADKGSVDRAVSQIQRLFLLRTCEDSVFRNRSRPCLLHQIHKCTAPCVGLVSESEYAQQVSSAKAFLQGKRQDIARKLQDEMMKAASEERFEDAARLRDRHKALMAVQEGQSVVDKGVDDADILGVALVGGKVCVQTLFVRAGQSRGNREHHFDAKELSHHEALLTFLEQFYTKQPPPKTILLPFDPDGLDWLVSVLEDLWDMGVKCVAPQRGPRKKLVEMATRNANEALARQQAHTKAWSENLKRLAEFAGLDSVSTVEVYDNSHIQGANALGVAVVATQDGFVKSRYRRYNFPPESGVAGNDVGMMTEMFKRRFGKAKKDTTTLWPDLLIIDGGITQLRAALQALREVGVDLACVGMAKGVDRNAGKEVLHFPDGRAVALPQNDPCLHFMQRLRDEAHRFAITSHRSSRARSQKEGPLDGVEGLGPAKRRALVSRFGSQKAALSASLTELQQVPGISETLAQRIVEHRSA